MSELPAAILWGGGLCGVLDGLAATISFAIMKVPAMRVWQNVASGALGPKSFEKGWKSGILGLVFHFLIAFSAAAVYCLAALRLSFLLQRPFISGAQYGIAVFLVMNLIVLPLSAMPQRPASRGRIITQVVIHIFCVGLPISITASGLMLRN
jgi:hypothetical protein